MKVYFLRHQAAGVLHEHPFATYPSYAQLAPLLERLRILHGERKKPGADRYWWRVVSFDVLEDGVVPDVPMPDTSSTFGRTDSTAAVAPLQAGGEGFVRNPR